MENWKHNKLTDNELGELVRDVYDNKVFTSLHLRDYDKYLIGSIFIPVMFIGTPPIEPSFPKPTGNICVDRKNKLLRFGEIEEWKIKLKEWEDDTEKREKYMNEIGMVYEQNSKAGPRCINGYPMFFSCVIVSIENTKRFIEMYNKYVKLRKEFENDWNR